MCCFINLCSNKHALRANLCTLPISYNLTFVFIPVFLAELPAHTLHRVTDSESSSHQYSSAMLQTLPKIPPAIITNMDTNTAARVTSRITENAIIITEALPVEPTMPASLRH